MARELVFPRTRHLVLSAAGQAQAGAEAAIVPVAVAEELARAVPPVGTALPSAAQPGAPGVPEPGALPAASPVPALAPGAAPASAPPKTAASAPPGILPRVVEVDIGSAGGERDRCRDITGAELQLRCPSSLEGREHAGLAAAHAARLGEAVLLSGLDRWYRLGAEGAGYCRSCELALVEQLREAYGDHVQPFDPLEGLKASSLPLPERPFARQKSALRLADAQEAVKRAVLRARDEARRARSLEIAVLGKVGPMTGLSLALCRHLDGLVFELASFDPQEALLPLLAARAALGQRPAIGLVPEGATIAQVRQLAALSSACDTDLMLPSSASPEAEAALEGHLRFMRLVRERFRPQAPLVDAELLVSPSCDHWTDGAHLKAASAALQAVVKAQLLPAVRLELSGGVKAPLLILAAASALPPADAQAARRHVEGGGDALILGQCLALDEEGRPGEPLFPEVKSGLDRVKEGRVYRTDDSSPAALARALRELAGRGRAQITLAGRGKLFARAYLDPERKLDVHLVNLDGALAPAQGVQVSIAGQAAGGGRLGYWFSPERDGGKDGERITLSPSGFSVSTILPSVSAYALLAIPR